MKGRASIIRLCFTVIFLFIATYTFSACTPTPPHCASSEVFCVGLVIGTGVVDDNSINQSSWEALQQSYTEGFVNWIYYIETNDARDYDENIAVFAEAGYDVVVTSGSYLAEASLAGAQTYPQVMFIAVDQPAGTFTSQGKTSPPNLVGLIFPEDHAGFLAGALAAMMTQTDKIGAICSTDEIASIWHYCEGYRAGAAYIDQRVAVTVIYHEGVDFDQASDDWEWGTATANSIIDTGVDVVLGAGGKTGQGAMVEAAQRGVYTIGIESDQYYQLPDATSRLLTSAIILIKPSVYKLIRMAADSNLPGGTDYLGEVGYAPYHDLEDEVPDMVKTRMEEINRGLLNGSIEIGAPLIGP